MFRTTAIIVCILLSSRALALANSEVLELAKLLKNADAQEAAQAAERLGELGPEAAPAVPALIAALSDRRLVERPQLSPFTPTVGSRASAALRAIGSPAVAPLIAELTAEGDSSKQFYIFVTLEGIGPAAKDALPILESIIKGNDKDSVRINALAAYCSISENEQDELGVLLFALEDSSAKVRGWAAQELGSADVDTAAAVAALIGRLDDAELHNYAISIDFSGERPVRETAIISLGHIGSGANDALPHLIEIMNRESETPTLRISAALAVSRIDQGNGAAMDLLISLLNRADDERRTLHAAADALGQLVPHDDRALSALKDAIHSAKREYRRELIQGFAFIEHEKIIPLLDEVVQDSDSDLDSRAIAAEALGRFGEAAKPSVPALVKAVYAGFDAEIAPTESLDYDRSLFYEALYALGELGPFANEALDDLRLIRQSLDDDSWKDTVDEVIDKIISEK